MKEHRSMPTPVEIVRVLAMLVIGSIVYDLYVVTPAEEHVPLKKSVTPWEVVGGVMYSLVGFLILTYRYTLTGLESFMLLLLVFAASGSPMILGSQRRAQRYVNQRK